MKRRLDTLPDRYLAALRAHLKKKQGASLERARGLGRQALEIGLETLDVARIHERALATLEASASSDGIIKRANIFFAETIMPIEETHRNALKASARLGHLKRMLSRRNVRLTTANRSLKRRIAERKTVEAALKKSGEHYETLLRESLALQKHLQRLTHRMLMVQEDKRKKISHDLQDEIAQTLLGINVRLLTLKQGADCNARSLQKDVATTQSLVDMSAKTIERVAREIGKDPKP